jgi:hypothetical protein
MIMDASINVAMEPFGSVADLLPSEQRTLGFLSDLPYSGLVQWPERCLPYVLNQLVWNCQYSGGRFGTNGGLLM